MTTKLTAAAMLVACTTITFLQTPVEAGGFARGGHRGGGGFRQMGGARMARGGGGSFRQHAPRMQQPRQQMTARRPHSQPMQQKMASRMPLRQGGQSRIAQHSPRSGHRIQPVRSLARGQGSGHRPIAALAQRAGVGSHGQGRLGSALQQLRSNRPNLGAAASGLGGAGIANLIPSPLFGAPEVQPTESVPVDAVPATASSVPAESAQVETETTSEPEQAPADPSDETEAGPSLEQMALHLTDAEFAVLLQLLAKAQSRTSAPASTAPQSAPAERSVERLAVYATETEARAAAARFGNADVRRVETGLTREGQPIIQFDVVR